MGRLCDGPQEPLICSGGGNGGLGSPQGIDENERNCAFGRAGDHMTKHLGFALVLALAVTGCGDDGTFGVKDLPEESGSGSAAGALRASAGDLARVLVRADGDPYYPDILSPSTLDLMEERPFPDASNYALGWSMRCQGGDCDHKRLSHSGVTDRGGAYIAKFDGFTSQGIDINGVTVAITVNRGSASGLEGLAHSLARIVADTDIDDSVDFFDDAPTHFLPET